MASTTGFRFEPTFGASTWCPSTPYEYGFPTSKTYGSIFNRPTEMPCPTTMPTMERLPYYYNPMSTFDRTITPLERTSWYPSNTYERYPWSWPMMNWSWPMSRWSSYPVDWTPSPSYEWMAPSWWCNSMSTVGYRPCNPIELYCLTNPIRVLDRDGNREIFLCFDLRGYKPEEVNVTFNKTERSITVEACHDVKEGKEHVTRKYFRKFIMPETLAKCDLSKCDIKSWFGRDGLLNVECPLPRMTNEEIARCPISTEYFRNPYLRSTICPTSLPVNTKPVNVKVC